MKELTIEQKAQRYDEAIEIAKRINNEQQAQPFNIMTRVFPELKESEDEDEDEKIRKSIIAIINNYVDNSNTFKPKMIAWLEKQSQTFTKEDTDNANKVEPKDYNGIDPYFGKPVDKVESKFKVGDWVVVDGITQKVTHIQTDGFDTDRAWNGKSTFKDVHLWTIADVKDCDVLVDVYGNVGIYKSHDDFSWLSYCSLGYYGGFQHFTIEHDNEKTYPATKEQRERFFAAMHDAGYEWNAEKKELKKIEQKPIDCNEEYYNEELKSALFTSLRDAREQYLREKNAAWSEEDEKMVNNILTPLAGRFPWDIYQPMYDWLKSLKQRIGE